LRNVSFFANATLLGAFSTDEASGVPALQNPAYLSIDKLGPRPQMPDGFRVSYPDAAKSAGLKATVRVGVLLDESGRVVDAVGLDDNEQYAVLVAAAVQVLRRTQFTPGQFAGKPVKSKVVVSVRFSYE
jgi:TonB family protein